MQKLENESDNDAAHLKLNKYVILYVITANLHAYTN